MSAAAASSNGATEASSNGSAGRFEELAPFPDRSAELTALVGQTAGPPTLSPHAVNVPMIRHWVEAMGDHNPVYVSDEAARAAGYDELIAPPTMLQAWIMRGLRASLLTEEARDAGTAQGDGPSDRMMQLLDEEGLTSVVATNCEQQYGRPLVVGDRLLVRSVIEAISDPKRTGLGTGRFLTTRLDFVAVPDAEVPVDPPADAAAVQSLYDAGEPVATMRFRILKYLPPQRKAARPPRPHPALTQDNAFWFEGARAHHLLIQRCTSCGTLRHPPLPACANCGSLEWDTVDLQRPRHLVLLRGRALPPGAGVRVPAADRPGRARRGDARRGQPERRRAGGHRDRHAAAGRVRGLRRGAVAARSSCRRARARVRGAGEGH